jgi:hypothetical protein
MDNATKWIFPWSLYALSWALPLVCNVSCRNINLREEDL